MERTLEDIFSSIIRQSSAQRELVYRAALALAVEVGDQELADHIARAMANEAHQRDLERRREASGRSRAEYLPEVPGLDDMVDRSFTGVRDVVRGHMNGNEKDAEVQTKGKELLLAIFPGGVGGVTGLPYVDEARMAEDIVHKLQNELADHVAFFGLQRKVAALAALVAEYSDAVKRSRAYVLATEVKAADDRGQRFLLEVVCRVLGMNFDSDNPSHVANRARVLEVLYHQMEQTRERRATRRRRAAAGDGDAAAGDVDVDVDVDVDGDGADTDVDGGADASAGLDVSAG